MCLRFPSALRVYREEGVFSVRLDRRNWSTNVRKDFIKFPQSSSEQMIIKVPLDTWKKNNVKQTAVVVTKQKEIAFKDPS